MRPAILVFALLLLAACESDKPAAKPAASGAAPAGTAKEEAASAAAPDAKGRTSFVQCLDLIREKRYPEALPVCREALDDKPDDPQLKRAIEIAESGGEG
jgi:hypothetical protein